MDLAIRPPRRPRTKSMRTAPRTSVSVVGPRTAEDGVDAGEKLVESRRAVMGSRLPRGSARESCPPCGRGPRREDRVPSWRRNARRSRIVCPGSITSGRTGRLNSRPGTGRRTFRDDVHLETLEYEVFPAGLPPDSVVFHDQNACLHAERATIRGSNSCASPSTCAGSRLTR